MGIEEILVLIALGAIGGFLSGLLGVGGGVIFIPVFEYYFGAKLGFEGEELVRFILANSFAAIVVAGISATRKHRKMGRFYPRMILTIAIPAIVTGSVITQLIASRPWYKEEYFKGLFILVLFYTVVRTLLKKHPKEQEEAPIRSHVLPLIGMAAGAVSSLSGLGGGVALIPLLTGFAKLDMKKASAVSIGVIPVMVLPYVLIYSFQQTTYDGPLQFGYLSVLALLPVSVGVLVFSSLGVKVAQRSHDRTLRYIFATLILILIVKFTIQLIQ